MTTDFGTFLSFSDVISVFFVLYVMNKGLSAEDKRRRDRRTPRAALKKYRFSSFKYLFDSKNDQALLNCCGLDHAVFAELLSMFEPLFHRYTLDDKGKIRP